MSEFTQIARDIRNRCEIALALIKEAKKEMTTGWDDEKKLAYKEFGVIQKDVIEKTFKEAVDQWYAAYSPIFYDRQGRGGKGGLYNILSLYPNSDGMYDDENTSSLYNPGGMHGDREGGDLYNKVFIEGWHGGAESGPFHPSSGTPWYRTPHPSRVRAASKKTGSAGRPWVRWSYSSFQSEPASKMFAENMARLHSGKLQTEYDKIMRLHHDTVQKRVDEIIESINRIITGY